MRTLAALVAFATFAVPVLTEAAARAWAMPVSKSMGAKGKTVLSSLAGIALATLVVTASANAAGYTQQGRSRAPTAYNTQANPFYGFGPRVRVHPNDVIAGDRIIGRDPDPFIRGQILREYNSGRN